MPKIMCSCSACANHEFGGETEKLGECKAEVVNIRIMEDDIPNNVSDIVSLTKCVEEAGNEDILEELLDNGYCTSFQYHEDFRE